MTTVVPTSEEDPALSVVRFTAEMAWAEAGPEVLENPIYCNPQNAYFTKITEAVFCRFGFR